VERLLPDPIDEHLGRRVRARRRELRLTLQALAMELGVGFQQVQKYETGHNKMSAGTLWQIATALGVRVDYFFQDLPKDRESGAA
jgi:transcriptional regulator with XRE-family HTH domain